MDSVSDRTSGASKKCVIDCPPDWTFRVSGDGDILFVNPHQHLTQWEHPTSSLRYRTEKNLPFGWERVISTDEEITFVNHIQGTTTIEDPRLQKAYLLDPSTNLSMERTDQLRQKFDSSSTADHVLHDVDLSGKTFLVTGGTSGVGSATVRALAKKGAHVVFTGRNAKAGSEITQTLERELGKCQVDFVPLDLCSLDSVRYFADKLLAKQMSLNGLILNAGVFGSPYELTVDGFESMFQVNVLSQVYLLVLLKPLLVQSAPSRVIFVSSESHRSGSLTSDTLSEQLLSPPENLYSAWTQYNNTKLFQVIISQYLQEHWAKDGIAFYSLHPGNMILTGLSRTWWFWRLVFGLARPFTKTLDQGAATTVYCAAAPELANEGGKYWNNCWMSAPNRAVLDGQVREALWELCQVMLAKKIRGYVKC